VRTCSLCFLWQICPLTQSPISSLCPSSLNPFQIGLISSQTLYNTKACSVRSLLSLGWLRCLEGCYLPSPCLLHISVSHSRSQCTIIILASEASEVSLAVG
jgi:hypothetical protein